MHLAFDARLYGLEHAGIGRYIKNLLTALWHEDKSNHYSVLLRQTYFKSLSAPPNVSKVLLDVRHYSLAEQYKVVNCLRSIAPDLVHIPHFNVPLLLNRPFVVTIHDILWHQVRGHQVTTLPALFYGLKYQGYRLTVAHAVSHAVQIITPSQFVKQQLMTTYPLLNEANLTVISEAVDPALILSAHGYVHPNKSSSSPYLVYTGSLYPHKNFVIILDALRLLLNEGVKLHLKVVSARDIFLTRSHAQVTDRHLLGYVHFLGFLKDSDLVSLYKHTVALIQPSTSEGFGLTGLEAMACRVPVIAASAGSMPEVYQDAALYFDPHDAPGLAKQIKLLLKNPTQKQTQITQGLARAGQFSWTKTAQQTLSLYQHTKAGNLPAWLDKS